MKYLTINPDYPWKAAKQFWKRHCYLPYPKDHEELWRGPPIEHIRPSSPFFVPTTLPKIDIVPEKHLCRRTWSWEYNLIIDRR